MSDYADFGPTVDNRGVAGHEFSDYERQITTLTAQVDGLQRALAQSQASAQGLAALAESLQNRLASRPLTVADTTALEAENDKLTARVAELEAAISAALSVPEQTDLSPEMAKVLYANLRKLYRRSAADGGCHE